MTQGEECYPKLVVFDLDACCWFPEMYMMSSGPPYKKVKGNMNKMVASNGEEVKLLGITRAVWALLQAPCGRFRNTRVAIASRCDEPAWARELLKLFEAAPDVSFWDVCEKGDLVEIYKGSKKGHFKALQKKTGIAFEDMCFFDDDPVNIRDVSSLGVVCVLTPDGVTSDAWEKGLRDYAKAHGKPIPAAVAPEPEPPKAEEPKAEPPKAEEPSKPLPWYKASPP